MAEEAKNDAARIDDEAWKRARKNLQEKARLYDALRRGDVEDEEGLVNFDQKWVEEGDVASESGDGDGSDESDEEVVEYIDEFGRARKGTKAQALREERRRGMEKRMLSEGDRFSARPAMPGGLIYGDTVQAGAFDPDEPVAVKMAELAAKRDREPTPPPDVHYDSKAEVRTKGTGFFAFSKDEEERKKQMEGLEDERLRTENVRAEKANEAKTKIEERRREIEERRRKIQEQKSRTQADRFLESLGADMLKSEHAEEA